MSPQQEEAQEQAIIVIISIRLSTFLLFTEVHCISIW